MDAFSDNERASTRTAAREGEAVPQESEARAVNVAVKSADEEELDMTDVGKTLRVMQEERWQQLEWVDEDVTHPSPCACW